VYIAVTQCGSSDHADLHQGQLVAQATAGTAAEWEVVPTGKLVVKKTDGIKPKRIRKQIRLVMRQIHARSDHRACWQRRAE
jgi:hypothetical protein